MRHDWLVAAITLVEPRELIDNCTTKYNLIRGLFIIMTEVLATFINRLLTELIDNLLNAVK